MEEYKSFDKYLSDSKQIQAFIDNRLSLMFEVFKIPTLDSGGKSHWIEKIGSEFETVIELIEKMEDERSSLSVR